MTELTTIFNGDQDDRYVMLRSTRKEISKTVNTFLKDRKALLAMTPDEIAADVEIEGVQMDSDQSPLYIVMNTVDWVKTAHGCLDSFLTMGCWERWRTMWRGLSYSLAPNISSLHLATKFKGRPFFR